MTTDLLDDGSRPSRGRRPLRRRLAVAGLVTATLAGLTVTAAAAAPAVRSAIGQVAAPTAAAAPALPPCPKSTTPEEGGGYAVWVRANITDISLFNGWNEQRQIWQSVAESISAQACGLLHLPSLRVDIEPASLVFDTSEAALSSPAGIFLPTDFALRLTATGAATNRITGVNADGTLEVSASTPLLAEVVPGPLNGGSFNCKTTADATLTTGRVQTVPTLRGPDGPLQAGGVDPAPWTLQGSALSGTSLIGATADIVSNDFDLPAFDVNDFEACPSAFLLNIAFGGADADGEQYYTKIQPTPTTHPAGESWTTGKLTITEVDGDAIPRGAPDDPTGAIVPECVPAPGPPFRLGVAGSFAGGGIEVTDDVSVSDISGTLCGVATVVAPPPDHPTATVCTQLVAPGRGQRFADVKASITKIPGVRTNVAPVGIAAEDLVALFCDDAGVPDGQLLVDTTIRASAVPRLFGTECLVGPVEAVVKKAPLRGPLKQARATLTSPPFAISAAQPDGDRCPDGLAANTNAILGLPTLLSASGLSVEATAGLYLP